MAKEKKEEIKEKAKEEKVVVKKETPMSDSDKKKKMIQICVISVVLIIVLVVVLFLTSKSTKTQEEKLSKSLTDMGEKFYTEFYYEEISKGKTSSEVSEFLSGFQDIGIKVNLDNLSRYNDNENEEEIANFKNDKGEECNKTSTRAVIYPKSPYGKNDYTIEAELDCGFDSENEKK